jgi:hypothetical protein
MERECLEARPPRRKFINDRPSRDYCGKDRRLHPQRCDPYEKDPRTGPDGPSDELVQELRAKARKAGVLTPHPCRMDLT